MKRSPNHQATIDASAKEMFGRTETEARTQKCCVRCGSKKMRREDFKDEESRREAAITAFCQECQDWLYEGLDELEEDEHEG